MPTTLVMTTQQKEEKCTPADRMTLREDSQHCIPQDCSSKIHTHKTKSVNDNTWLPIPYHVPTANVCCWQVAVWPVPYAAYMCVGGWEKLPKVQLVKTHRSDYVKHQDQVQIMTLNLWHMFRSGYILRLGSHDYNTLLYSTWLPKGLN